MRFVISMLIGILSITLVVACQQKDIKLQENSDGIKRIAIADAKSAFDSGQAVIVDTRPAEAYKSEHIKGSINIPLSDTENRISEIPKDKLIITYCSWPNEHTSVSSAQKMKEKGITNTAALLGGTQAWKNAGYPMEVESKK